MTTVTGKLIGEANPARVEMLATLVDVTGKAAVGYVASVPGELVRPVPITAGADGSWTVSLTANALIESQAGDTLWAIQEGRAKDGTPIVTYVVVPETGGPYWMGSIRADLSATLLGDGSVVYLAGQDGPAGPAGADGAPGPAGADGDDGASAYELAVAAGFTGTQTEWLASLIGPEGEPGDPATNLVTSVNGEQGVVVLDAAKVGADPAGTAGTAVSTHSSATTSVHGISDTAALETATGASTKVANHAAATDPHGDRAWADTKFALATGLTALDGTVNNLSTSVTAIDGFLNDCLTRVAAIEQGTAWLGGLNVDGNAQIVNGDLTVSGNLAATGNALGEDTPAAHGIAAWTYDPALAVNSTQLTNGTLYLVRVNIAANVSATKIYWWVANVGFSPVSGQNQVGLYDSSGILLAATTVDADISTATLKTTTIAAQSLTAGAFYWIGMVFNASGTPTLTRASGWTGVNTAANLGLTAATSRFATNGTSRTALPSSITPASNVGTDFAGPWAAVGA